MSVVQLHSEEQIWEYLKEITDPEIPVLNIVEMGIARSVQVEGNHVQVRITPTYSGCPAMAAIEKLVNEKLEERGVSNFDVKLDFSETWTTDWMTEEAKAKLKNYGIAPPEKTSDQNQDDFLSSLKSTKIIPCPFCDSLETELQSQFGSTACKSQYFCNNCHQPFEHFKCI
ncbi:MAG: phenylacetate-CoA oxygenase subunit PaaJ [Balneolaceae bacterium]|nr:phenylacetate-CoA oxygenase subunit PaaJ [Balneolaceae bacterium]